MISQHAGREIILHLRCGGAPHPILQESYTILTFSEEKLIIGLLEFLILEKQNSLVLDENNWDG